MQRISSELSLIRKSFSGGFFRFFVFSVELALGKWFFDHFRRARELAWYRENPSLSAQHSNRVIGKLWENFCRQFFFPAVVCVGKRMSGIWKLNKPIFQCPADDDFPSLYDYIVCTWASSLAPSVQCVVKLWQFFSMCFERGRRRKHENVLLNFFLSHALVEAERVCCTTQFLIKFTRQQCSSATGWKVKCVGAEEEDDMHQMAREREKVSQKFNSQGSHTTFHWPPVPISRCGGQQAHNFRLAGKR